MTFFFVTPLTLTIISQRKLLLKEKKKRKKNINHVFYLVNILKLQR